MWLSCFRYTEASTSLHQDILTGPLPGTILEILDGDTVTAQIHVWIGQDIKINVRLNGIDAPEMKGQCEKERKMAVAAQQELKHLLADDRIRLYDIRLEKYAGRVLARAKTTGGIDISEHMIKNGLAHPYHGEKRKTWCN